MRSGLLRRPVSAVLLGAIRGYQLVLSPLLGARCRYYPSCSRYAVGAIEVHGAAVGMFLGTWRLLRCHPWTPGGVDLVPARGSVRRYLAHGGCADPAHDPSAAGRTVHPSITQSSLAASTTR